jgi:ABC-type antimicrobial peptide transport system permease subunit
VQSENDYHTLRNELNKIQGIETIAGTKQHIGFWQRTASLEALNEMKESQYIDAGENYIKTLGLNIVAGRDFNAEGKGDIGNAMLINQHLAFEFGWKDKEAIGKQIKMDTSLCTVIGVLKDFVPGNFFEPMQSFAIRTTDPSQYRQLIVRAKPAALNKVYNDARATWAKLFPLKPFSGYYQSQATANSLRTNSSIATIFLWFAVISVLLTATGLFALISLTVLKKTREIAIRRVVGAEAKHIYQLVLKGYVLIFIVGAGLGCYAGYVLSKLLMDLIFRINAGVSLVSLWISLVCMLGIVVVTVISRIWAALNTKATEVLKGD